MDWSQPAVDDIEYGYRLNSSTAGEARFCYNNRGPARTYSALAAYKVAKFSTPGTMSLSWVVTVKEEA